MRGVFFSIEKTKTPPLRCWCNQVWSQQSALGEKLRALSAREVLYSRQASKSLGKQLVQILGFAGYGKMKSLFPTIQTLLWNAGLDASRPPRLGP